MFLTDDFTHAVYSGGFSEDFDPIPMSLDVWQVDVIFMRKYVKNVLALRFKAGWSDFLFQIVAFLMKTYTEKKENQIFIILYIRKFNSMTNGLLIYGEIFANFLIYQEALPHIWLCNCSTLHFLIYEENLIFFFISLQYNKCAAGLALLNLPKGKSLGRSKPETNSSNEQAH